MFGRLLSSTLAKVSLNSIVALLAQSQAFDCVDAVTSDGATALTVATHHGYIEVQLQLESQCNGQLGVGVRS